MTMMGSPKDYLKNCQKKSTTSPFRDQQRQNIFYYPCKVESTMSSYLLKSSKYSHRSVFRSGNSTDRYHIIERLSGKIAIHSLLRQGASESLVFPDQRSSTFGINNSPTLQGTMVSGVVLQMDQATSTDQGVLRVVGECGKNATLDRSMYICAHGYSQKKIKLEMSLYTILQVISMTIFEKMPILEAFLDFKEQELTTDDSIQLNLFEL